MRPGLASRQQSQRIPPSNKKVLIPLTVRGEPISNFLQTRISALQSDYEQKLPEWSTCTCQGGPRVGQIQMRPFHAQRRPYEFVPSMPLTVTWMKRVSQALHSHPNLFFKKGLEEAEPDR